MDRPAACTSSAVSDHQQQCGGREDVRDARLGDDAQYRAEQIASHHDHCHQGADADQEATPGWPGLRRRGHTDERHDRKGRQHRQILEQQDPECGPAMQGLEFIALGEELQHHRCR